MAVLDANQPVGHRHHVAVMSRKDERRTKLAVDFPHQAQDAFPRLAIQVGSRLVGQHNSRADREGPGDRHPLALAAA